LARRSESHRYEWRRGTNAKRGACQQGLDSQSASSGSVLKAGFLWTTEELRGILFSFSAGQVRAGDGPDQIAAFGKGNRQ
jgi:hypothetical protein